MKICSHTLKNATGCLLALGTLVAATRLLAADAQDPTAQSGSGKVTVTAGGGAAGGGGVSNEETVVLSLIEPTAGDPQAALKDRAWLGVAVEEGSEALASQLGLAPGSGLVVTYVTPDSPAAKAGLQKNDVLVELEGQLLVHPAQLRKLVQVRKEGDTVRLLFYRAGKKQTVSATLGKAPAGFGLRDDGQTWEGELGQWLNPPASDPFRQQMRALRGSLGNVKIDTAKVREEVRRGLEQARKALQDAFHSSSNAWGSAAKVLREFQRSGIDVDNNASVTVRSTGQRVKSLVKADESGTIVLVCNPKPHLTAHDKDGKLVFDGEIDTPEQRAKVPPELWEKVEPLLNKVAPKAEEDTEPELAPSEGIPPLPGLPPASPPPSGVPTL
jgi:hypothetical protein